MQRVFCLFVVILLFGCASSPDSSHTTSIRRRQAQPSFANEPHRELVISARSHSEAYDNAVEVMTRHFTNFTTENSAKTWVSAVSDWQRVDETDRLVRRRACLYIWASADSGETIVKVAVERQLSTQRSTSGELDRVSPAWSESSESYDLKLEKQMLLQISQRLQGRVITG